MKAVDLFCGAGGASLGMEWAGFDLLAGVDYDEQALKTHNENLPGDVLHRDLKTVRPDIVPPVAIDYVHGSPPCKGFSNANSGRRLDDPRNNLVFRYVKWVRELQPKVATMENVRGMVSITDHFMDRLCGAFRDAGYQVRWRLLNAADYGVPQTPRRIITVAVREDLEPPSRWFPRPTHAETATTTLNGRELEEWRTVSEAIGNLGMAVGEHRPQGDNNGTSKAVWRRCDQPAHTVKSQGSHVTSPDGGSIQDGRETTPPNHIGPGHDTEAMRRWSDVTPGDSGPPISQARVAPDQPSHTINAGGENGHSVHPPIHYETLRITNHQDATTDFQARRAGKGGKFDPRLVDVCDPAPTIKSGGGDDYRGQGDVLTVPIDKHPPSDAESSKSEGARRLTVWECARLQSFPDWFVFTGTKTSQYAQVGNAVPPLLQYHIARHLRDFIEDSEVCNE